MTQLSLEIVRDAISTNAAAFRSRTKLQPAGGEGDKVFPPTYKGGKYAIEKRRIPGRDEPVECVLLDSVQSQANRMEAALQQAVDAGLIKIPIVEIILAGGGLISDVGRVTSLQAPHRITDAILRDTRLDGKPFPESDYRKRLDKVSLANATPLYQMCPTALIFGMWDSTGPKGGLGAKFERAIVSEIVGIDAIFGVKTSSRIDPLQISKNAGPLYRKRDGGWTLDPGEAVDEMKDSKPTGKKALYRRDKKGKDVYYDPAQNGDKMPDAGRPSTANHGNIPPSISEVGGVTVSSAEQTVVLSLSALRRLRFPFDGGESQPDTDIAAQVVLASLALCAAALAATRGLDLRSRCLLWPAEQLSWELLAKPGELPMRFDLSAESAIGVFKEAVNEAEKAGLRWLSEPLVLEPSSNLLKLVRKSQELVLTDGSDDEGED